VTVIHDLDAFAIGAGKRKLVGDAPASDGVEVIPLHSKLGRLSPLLAQQTGQPTVQRKTLREIFKAHEFDVVHFHNSSLVGGPGVFGLARPAATLYSAHEHWLVCPTHVLWRHKREVCPARQCIRCQLRYRRPPQLWRYSPRLRRRLDNIDIYIAMSEFSREKHAEFGFPRTMEVLPPFADDAMQLTEDSPPHTKPYFFYAGRLEPIKGLQTVIPRMPSVPEVDLIVAGEGSSRRDLERMAGPQVRFLGAVGASTLASYYRHALATVVPSITYETFGLSLIESFANSTPVIARRLGPLSEIVDASEGGKLLSSDEELTSAMRSMANDASLRECFGRNARSGFEQRWSENAILPRYLELVESAIARRR
jgi:glycosyltransferase involved in cell wall biosynthesis